MTDDYVIEWGADGTAYLRRASLATPPVPPPDPPASPSEEDVPHGADEPFAYGRSAGPAASR